MSDEKPETWPLRPSHTAYVLEGLCLALMDVIHDEVAPPSRRASLKASGLILAAEVFSGELAHWFGSRVGEDHDLLEALQARYLEEEAGERQG